ncbi:hypothetical protein ACH5RR_024217 [Cinchona calisaya]|uniref:Uncharacterized protein n=1 Tax=Cinchona calisaya TaxID=153742 RepID=A0ABD2ZG79_9GENT
MGLINLIHIHSLIGQALAQHSLGDDALNTSSSAKRKMQKEKNSDLARRARAIVQAVTHYSDPEVLAEVSCGLGEAMVGIILNDDKV